jgi:hypothetical protein
MRKLAFVLNPFEDCKVVLIVAQLLPSICKLFACEIYDLRKILDDRWQQLIRSIIFSPAEQSPGYSPWVLPKLDWLNRFLAPD